MKCINAAAWYRAQGEHVEIIPALDGHGVDIVFRRTSKLSRAECADLQGIAHLPMPEPKQLEATAGAKQDSAYVKGQNA